MAPQPNAPERRAWLRQPITLFVVLAVAMLGGMALALRYEANDHIESAREEIAAIGELKARQIELWLGQRAAAAATSRNAITPRLVATQIARTGASPQRAALQHRLHSFVAELDLASATVLDAAGRVIASEGEPLQLDAVARQRLAEALRRDQPALHVLHAYGGPMPRLFLDYIIPWRAEPRDGSMVGALVLRHDARRTLFPLVQSWPTSSTSAETLLVRRDGDSVLFMNELRHRAGAALTLRRPLADQGLLAAHFLRGAGGTVRGPDYRGVEVLGYGRPITGTDWLLVAKIDVDEALAPVRKGTAVFGGLMLGVTLLAALGTLVLWRQKIQLGRLRERALRGERDALGGHLSLLSRHANDIVLLLDEAGRIVRANERAQEAYGKRSGAGTSAADLRAPGAAAGFADAYDRTLRLGSAIYETTHRRGDGREFPVEISARRIDTPEGRFVQAIIRDLSERRSAEQALAQSETRFRVMVEQSISGIYVIQDGRFAYVNPRFASIFGYGSPEEIIGRIPDDLIVPRDRSLVAANIERRLAGEIRTLAYTFTGMRKDGGEIEVGVHGSAATFDGRPAILGTLQDISERAHLERERAARVARMQAQLEAVAALSSSRALMDGDVEDFARVMTEVAAKSTGVARTNAWLFNPRETELRCVDLYEAEPARHSSGALLTEAQYRNEFGALKGARYVDADDPLTDARTAGYVEGYLKPLGITSMLDAVVRVGDRHIGLLCLEHVGQAHHWERDEIAFACQLADQLALAVVQRERKRAIDGLQATTVQLRKVNRAMRTLSAGNETLVRAADEATLLRDMCSVIVQAGNYSFAIVNYLMPGEGAPLMPKASAGVALEDFLSIPIPRSEDSHPLAALGAAIRSGKPELFEDLKANPGFAPWREFIQRHGIASGIGLPLRDGLSAAPFGVLFISSTEADAFDPEAVTLLAELANDLAFGIGILRLREEQRTSAAVLRKSLEDTILAIAATAEMRDPYTAGHERRVAELAAAIGREMGLGEPLVEGIRFGAMIHDLGKIKIPAEILVKPTRLTPIEYELIKQHAQAGYDILKGIDFPWPVAQMVLEHHERLDGSGYPQALKGDAILLEARILAVADTVEAMSSHRPYRPGLGLDKALAEIERGRGAQYDPDAVDACLRLFREKGYTLPG